MRFRRFIRLVLLSFVAFTVIVVVARNWKHAPLAVEEHRLPHQVIVFYFHGNERCEACLRVERFSRETVELFPEALAADLLMWRAVNREAPENEQYVRQFRLVTQTVVVANLHDGRITDYKILDDVLNRHEDREALIQYIAAPVRAYIEDR